MLIRLIENEFGLARSTVSAIVATAPHRYKVYQVPKKSGHGMRTIAQPAKEVKAFQRYIVKTVLTDLPIHDAAMAYVSGKGIRGNAEAHVRNRFLLKMDFSNYFPSLHPNDLEQHIERHMPDKFDAEDLQVISQVCFWKPRNQYELRLSIGGPSSPFISNTLMHEFDCRATELANENKVTYTRYADDLTFSTNSPNVLKNIEQLVSEIITALPYPRVTINIEKTIHTSKKHHRRVTGLVLSSQGNVSLGRDRKREISAMVHHAIIGSLDAEAKDRLKGLLAFAYDVEPSFVARLKEKYDSGKVERLLRGKY